MTAPLIIDSFAGGGGASTGIEMALGRSPDVAINHNAAALALHAANHPDTLHLDSNIWDVDPRTVAAGRPVGLLWASPDCTHFSKAKGGAPRDRNIRDLAWVIVRWAEEVKPDVICMENVEEFVTWGPLDDDGEPIKWLAGQTFELWISRLRRAGYRIRHRELRACDYGAPTIRKRFFLIARRDGRRIVWPKPTHGDPKSRDVQRGKLLPWRTAAEIIDWSLPCPSIFATSAEIMAENGLRAVRPLAANTLARIARGVRRYVLNAEKPFLVQLNGSDRRDRDPADPLATILAGGGHSALVAPMVTYAQQGGRTRDATIPLHTVTASTKDQNSLIAPILTHAYTSNTAGGRGDPEHPVKTITTGGHHAVVAPALASYYSHGGGRGVRTCATDEPIRTIPTENRFAAVSPFLATMRNSQKPWQGADEPTHTITAGGAGLTLVSAGLVQTGYGERPGQAPRVLDLEEPLGTVVAGGAKHAPFAAFLAQQNTDMVGHDARKPLSTIVGKGCTQTPVAAFFAKYYGAGTGASVDDPCHTITVADRFGHVQAALSAPPFSPEHEPRARQVADLLRAHGLWDEREFVTLTVDGAEFVVVDIGLRMLTPRELYRAQGFPDDYAIEGTWSEDAAGEWSWRPIPKSVQISCVGNSVCPPLAAAIVGANCPELRVEAEAATARAAE